MADSQYQGIIDLSDAQIREAESQAKIAQMMAETAVKWQEVQHKHLENLGLYLKIKWDAQAHENLHKKVLEAQHRVKELQEQKATMERKLSWAMKLLQGNRLQLEVMNQAWLGFYYIADRVPPSIVIDAYRTINLREGAFDKTSWDHPFHKEGSVVHDFVGRKNAAALFQWAAKNNYYPVMTEPAWDYMCAFLEKLASASENKATQLDAIIKDREEKALELSKIDWSRLQQQPEGGAQ